MKVGDLVEWKGLNGTPREWAGLGLVLECRSASRYKGIYQDEALICWYNGHTSWVFTNRLEIATEGEALCKQET